MRNNKDVGTGLDYFLSLGGHLLVPFLFHEMTSLYPLSFQRNDSSTCTATCIVLSYPKQKSVSFCRWQFIFSCMNVFPCSNTVSRSAIFCAVATTIERCKTEGVVDVFQVVKAMRVQKPGAIQTVVCINLFR